MPPPPTSLPRTHAFFCFTAFQKELVELLQRQALEANPAGQEEGDEAWADDEDDEEERRGNRASGGSADSEVYEDAVAELEQGRQSLGTASTSTSEYSVALCEGMALPNPARSSASSSSASSLSSRDTSTSTPTTTSGVLSSASRDTAATAPTPRPAHLNTGANVSARDIGTPPRVPPNAAQAAAANAPPLPPRPARPERPSPPPPAAPAPATPRQQLTSAAAAIAGGAFALAGAVGSSVVAPAGPVLEPARLKGLVDVLQRLGVPVLELAFFSEEQRSGLVVRDPNEAARGALHAIHALKDVLAPPYPISEACEARRVRAGAAEAAAAAVAALIASGEDHGRDGRGRKLRLRWGALEAADMDALVQVWGRGGTGGRYVVNLIRLRVFRLCGRLPLLLLVLPVQ